MSSSTATAASSESGAAEVPLRDKDGLKLAAFIQDGARSGDSNNPAFIENLTTPQNRVNLDPGRALG